jgi:hypothetical protein
MYYVKTAILPLWWNYERSIFYLKLPLIILYNTKSNLKKKKKQTDKHQKKQINHWKCSSGEQKWREKGEGSNTKFY